MSEQRKLKNRKRKARHISGRAVRLSNELLSYVDKRRQKARSYDAFFRRVFGLPAWDGTPQPLIEGCLEITTGRFFPRMQSWDQAELDANEVAIIEAAKKKTRKVNKPVRMREIS